MKRKIFTLAVTLMGSTFLFAQQWIGANNTTGDISRTGKVSIGTSLAPDNLNVASSAGIHNGYEVNTYKTAIGFYPTSLMSPASQYHVIATNMIQHSNSSSPTFFVPSLIIGSIADKSLVVTNQKIGIGTENMFCDDCTDYRLFVKDGIRTEKIKVDIAATNGWADYVLKKITT